MLEFLLPVKSGRTRSLYCPGGTSLKPQRLRRQEVHAVWSPSAASLAIHLATGGGGSSSASNNVERISSSNFLDVRGSVGHRHRRFSARSVAQRVRHGGHQDVYRNEPFQVIKGSSSMFGCRATVISTRCRGFVKFHLLKGPEAEDHTLYASHTVWKDRATFEAWTGGVTPTLKKGMCFARNH
jgi:heme-degrading monooxygenase HmoA